MKQLLLIMGLILAIAGTTSAKDGYHVVGTVRNNNDSMVFLCYYFGNGTTVQKLDSARLVKGEAPFNMKGSKAITSGMYMLLFADKSQQVEFILDNGATVNCSFEKGNVNKTIKFENDVLNDAFYSDKKFIEDIQPRVTALSEKLKSGKKKDTTEVNEGYEKINSDIFAFRDDIIAKHTGTTLGVLFKSMKEAEVPKKIPFLADGKTKDSTYPYRVYKGNYWNNWDFKDDRLIYAPVYDAKLEKYFTSLVLSVPDSFNKEADIIMSKVKCGTDMYKYSMWWLTRFAGTSKIMGMDESYLYMIEKYIMGPNYCGHLDSATKAAYEKDAIRFGTSIIGMKGRDIIMQDQNEKTVSLYNTCKQGDYTMLVFYDPTCHHCEKEVPSVDSAISALEKKLNITIMRYMVQNADEDEKWRKFIVDKKINGPHNVNVHNPSRTGSYRQDYNVYSNPIFFLLDKDAIIKGKRLDHTNLGGYLEFLERQKQKK
jgi:hypothetical protein